MEGLADDASGFGSWTSSLSRQRFYRRSLGEDRSREIPFFLRTKLIPLVPSGKNCTFSIWCWNWHFFNKSFKVSIKKWKWTDLIKILSQQSLNEMYRSQEEKCTFRHGWNAFRQKYQKIYFEMLRKSSDTYLYWKLSTKLFTRTALLFWKFKIIRNKYFCDWKKTLRKTWCLLWFTQISFKIYSEGNIQNIVSCTGFGMISIGWKRVDQPFLLDGLDWLL